MALTQSDRVRKRISTITRHSMAIIDVCYSGGSFPEQDRKRENHKKITESEHNDNNGPCTMYMALYDTTSRNEHKKNNNNNNKKKNTTHTKNINKMRRESSAHTQKPPRKSLGKKKNGIVDLMCTLFFRSFALSPLIRDDSIWTCAICICVPWVGRRFAGVLSWTLFEAKTETKTKIKQKKPEILHKITKLFALCI